MPKKSIKKRLNKFFFIILTGLFVCAVIEGISLGGLHILAKSKNLHYTPLNQVTLSKEQVGVIKKILANQSGHAVYDAQLGWTLQSSDDVDEYQINNQSIRASREYSLEPPRDKLRIATIGDSFTFGQQVANDETWQYFMEQSDRKLEVLNFGVGGYGQDQALLRYQDQVVQFQPKVVIFGFISENVFRNVNVFRPFYSRKTLFPLTKPRFILENDRLKILPNPFSKLTDYQKLLDNPKATLRTLGKRDFFYNQLYYRSPMDVLATVRLFSIIFHNISAKIGNTPLFYEDDVFNVESTAYQISIHIFDEYVKQVKAQGSIPIIVVLPTKRDLSRMMNGQKKRYRPFLNYWKRRGYNIIDLNEVVIKDGVNANDDTWFTEDGHNSADLNRIIAAHLLQFLENDIFKQAGKK